MFIWVNQGIVEPYVPKLKHNQIKKVSQLYPGTPENPVEIGEHEDSVEISNHDHTQGHVSAGHGSVADYYSKEEKQLKEERKQVYFAKDIMSKDLHCLSPEDKVNEVEDLFNSRRFRHMPVIDDNNKLLGILSERDLLKYTIEKLRNSFLNFEKEKISEIMKKKILTAFPDTPIREIARIMFEEKVGSVPILDRENHTLVGIVTRSDVLRRVMNNPPLDLYS